MDGGRIRIRYEDIPESDITTVDGLRVTTPLRTVIDLATEVDAGQLDTMIDVCLARRLFTLEEAFARLDRPDMVSRTGARVLRRHLRRRSDRGSTG